MCLVESDPGDCGGGPLGILPRFHQYIIHVGYRKPVGSKVGLTI